MQTMLRASEFKAQWFKPAKPTKEQVQAIKKLKPPKWGKEAWYRDMGIRFNVPAKTIQNIILGNIYR